MSFAISRFCMALMSSCLLLTACASPAAQPSEPATVQHVEDHDEYRGASAELPNFEPVAVPEGEKLHGVATSNIVADVVAQVGGNRIELYTMLPVGADPHSYQATPQDLRMLTDAHIIFINGLGLEEAMALALEDFGAKTVAVNTGFTPHEFGENEDEHAHDGIDPHTWFSIHAVEIWTQNIARVLGDVDPANAEDYAAAANIYVEELETLHAELKALVMQVPPEQRKLVTDHDSLGYLAAAYGFEIIGSVIPSFSTLAEPSAQQLAALQNQIREHEVKAIFVGTTVNPNLQTQLAQDLDIQIVTIYTGSLSDVDGPAATYIDFMRYNVGVIVDALR